MLLLRASQLRALACLCLCLNLVAAGLVSHIARDDAPTVTSTTPTATSDGGDNGSKTTTSPDPTTSATGTASGSLSSSPSVTTDSSSTAVVSSIVPPAPTPTLGNGTDYLNTTLFNVTFIPPGELPLQPVVTPGWAVAGVIMLVSGVVYTLIGIKMKWLHTYFSTAYLASLSTAVLIVYVMNPPVSNAVQGAYVVAVVMTGAILGGGALVFKEITEGLGCLLGGFCFSMWLLTLQPGGLLPATSGKVAFIACFTVVAFAFYFSHWTRTYALIGLISFAGATVTVLGIDCFSRAGLKEFWAYVWNLNDNLFPLGVNTYPLTKGIKVELAATVIIFLAGIISQLKLWRVIKERRARRDAERAEGERVMQQEEETVGRQIEEANARERGRWEAVYGDGEVPPTPRSIDPSADSGVGDVESEKRVRYSHGTVTLRSRPQSDAGEPIEMSELTARGEAVAAAAVPKPKAAAEVVMMQDEKNRAVTVRVARDDVPEASADDNEEGLRAKGEREEPKVWVVGTDGEARPVSGESRRRSGAGFSRASLPEIVPLPFKIPVGDDEEDREDAERSSVATFADEDEEALSVAAAGNRKSLAKRLSQGSMDLLRSISQRSQRSPRSPKGGGMESPQLPGESREELVLSRASGAGELHNDFEHNDNESVAATIDGMSSDGGDADTVRNGECPRTIEIDAQLGMDPGAFGRDLMTQLSPTASTKSKDLRPISTSETVSTGVLKSPVPGASPLRQSFMSEATDLATKTEATTTEKETPETTADGGALSSGDGAKKAKSATSTDSAPASLTKEKLPRGLSKVALSYRTNEWAKHLSNAEAPEPEPLRIVENPESPTHDAAPVNISELQQTAENATPPPAVSRSVGAMSGYASAQPGPAQHQQALSRSNSRQSTTAQGQQDLQAVPGAPAAATAPVLSPANMGVYANPYRNISANSRRTSGLLHQSIAEENDGEQLDHSRDASPLPEDGPSSGPNSTSPSPLPPDPSASATSLNNRAPVPGVVSYASPQTLIGKREMLLRSKSQLSFVAGGAPTAEPAFGVMPTIPSQPASDAGSIYNYPAGAIPPAPASPIDLDDLPMSQRKELMRQNSQIRRSLSGSRPTTAVSPASGSSPGTFDSHQPKRGLTHLPSAAVREAQLASFRSSVAAELRAGTPVVPSAGAPINGRETPLLAGGLLGTSPLSSLAPAAVGYGRDTEVRRSIDAQRSALMSQKEAEAQRREVERLERERSERLFEERMRRGDLLEAHRDAMRRMQAAARDS